MEEAIERVDQLVRKNNAKYKDQQSQKAYEEALKEYERQAKAELARQYAQAVKEGNRRAVEKAKIAKQEQAKKKPKRKTPLPIPVQPQPQKKVEIPKKRMSEAEVKVVNQTIEARAQRIIQEQQLQRLNRKLEEQRKRTKLYDLNEKCKKMLSKSHERIVTAKNIPQQRMKILRKLEDKAVGEINELDCIINNLIDKANANARGTSISQAQSNKEILGHHHDEQHEDDRQIESDDEDYNIDEPFDFLEGELPQEGFNNLQNNFLSMNTLIFEKSSEELLKMDYIPL